MAVDTTRRGFFGLVAGAVAAPLVVKPTVETSPVTAPTYLTHQGHHYVVFASTAMSTLSTPLPVSARWREDD